jgi:uncharacterized membrane-anchored protein
MEQPVEHPLRHRLVNETHTRPYAEIGVPVQVSHMVLLTGELSSNKESKHLAALAEQYGVVPPPAEATHYAADFGSFSLKWDRHTEFSSYTFFTEKDYGEPFSNPAIHELPSGWLGGLEGELLVAQHVEIIASGSSDLDRSKLLELFREESLVGSYVGGTAAKAWTDFRLQKDGFSRLLVQDKSLTPQQTSRFVQHFLEMESYRILAMLGFPLVERYGLKITEMGARLAKLTRQMTIAETLEEERELLEELTALEADVEAVISATSYRFGATKAYKTIVFDRVRRLREHRIEGAQMLSRYLERRFQPAMSACESVSKRLESLSSRVSRASQILMARVDIGLVSQNRDLLHSMDRRASLQLRLQETIEGLSIAAISYYIVGLVSYLVKALKAVGIALNSDLAVGVSIPLVLVGVWWGVRRIKKKLIRNQDSL